MSLSSLQAKLNKRALAKEKHTKKRKKGEWLNFRLAPARSQADIDHMDWVCEGKTKGYKNIKREQRTRYKNHA